MLNKGDLLLCVWAEKADIPDWYGTPGKLYEVESVEGGNFMLNSWCFRLKDYTAYKDGKSFCKLVQPTNLHRILYGRMD